MNKRRKSRSTFNGMGYSVAKLQVSVYSQISLGLIALGDVGLSLRFRVPRPQ